MSKERTRIRDIWRTLKRRCNNPKDKDYKRYGGRGVTICDQWANDFEIFYNWCIDNKLTKGLQIDRIDNNKGYCKDNCRVVTPKENSRNKSNNLFITYKGITKRLIEWSEDLDKKYDTLYHQIYVYNWSLEKVLDVSRLCYT